MSSVRVASRLARQTQRSVSRSLSARHTSAQPGTLPYLRLLSPIAPRWLSTSPCPRAGLMPDTHVPQPPSTEEAPRATQPTEISEEEYHEMAEEFMETVCERAEQVQESRQDVEVEYSAGVLTLAFPPNGTYVLNKQPPNKQIWLSSPISGPKRFDWVVIDESTNHKEGGGQGEWIYLRDGTKLTALLRKELGLDMGIKEDVLEASRDPLKGV